MNVGTAAVDVELAIIPMAGVNIDHPPSPVADTWIGYAPLAVMQ
jgi:hypothetical protein